MYRTLLEESDFTGFDLDARCVYSSCLSLSEPKMLILFMQINLQEQP